MKKIIIGLMALTSISAFATEKINPYEIYEGLSSLNANDVGGYCGQRADVWAYELMEFNPKKVVLNYPDDEFKPNNWDYHVAPTIKIDGEIWVFEKNHNGITEPMKLIEWMRKINNGVECDFITDETTHFRADAKCFLYEKNIDFYTLNSNKKKFTKKRVMESCLLTFNNNSILDPDSGKLVLLDRPLLKEARHGCKKIATP